MRGTDTDRPTRSDVTRDYGHPWPWRVEELLREEFDRRDGDIDELARAFDCHAKTIDKWVRRFGLRDQDQD